MQNGFKSARAMFVRDVQSFLAGRDQSIKTRMNFDIVTAGPKMVGLVPVNKSSTVAELAAKLQNLPEEARVALTYSGEVKSGDAMTMDNMPDIDGMLFL